MRYLPLSDADRATMLAEIGVATIDDLFVDVPRAAASPPDFDLPDRQSELAVDRYFRDLSAASQAAGEGPFFLGCGAYRHHVPATVDHLIQRGEFLTAYTPYQPEISQGTLQYLFEFQTQVASLTGMEVANASLYDGSTAAAEAVLMASRITRRGRALLSGNLHPHYREVIRTTTRFTEDRIEPLPPSPGDPNADLKALSDAIDEETSCVVVQNPDIFGNVSALAPLADAAHDKGALLIVVVTEAVSLGLLRSPGEAGADIVVGEGQSIGNGLNFGGPFLGLFATRKKFVRQMPGRLCGVTVDGEGNRGFVLTLSTREQHIRREKATSNICTNSGLCSLAFTIHMCLLGGSGLYRLAQINHARAAALAKAVAAIPGVELLTKTYFNEVTARLMKPAADVVNDLATRGILAGIPASRLFPGNAELKHDLILAATELTRDDEIETLAAGLGEALK